jgi:fatty-acyl-CoA synthase
MANLVAHSKPKVILVENEMDERLPSGDWAVVHIVEEADADYAGLNDNSGNRLDLRATGFSLTDPTSPVRPSDPVLLIYTSGTTGSPKGALLTQANVLIDALSQAAMWRLRKSDHQLLAAPMAHTAGMILLTQASLLCGCSISILPSWDVDAALAAISGHQITSLAGGLVIFDQLSRAGSEVDLRRWLESIRLTVAGGSPHTKELDARIMRTVNPVDYMFGYGMTESTSFVTCTRNTEHTLAHPLSIGYPVWHTECRLVPAQEGHDVDASTTLGADEPGELIVRGPTISPGYYRLDASDGPQLEPGWFRTGDILRRDSDYNFYFVDRARDMIRTGSLNVYAADVEAAIRQYASDLVCDVAVVGAPSKRWSEAVVAFVVPNADTHVDAQVIRSRLHDRVGHYKIPKAVFFVPSNPREEINGKIDKRSIRALLGDSVVE